MRRLIVVCCIAVLVLGNLALNGCQQEAPSESIEKGLTADSKPSDAQREQMRKSRMPPSGLPQSGSQPAAVPPAAAPPGPKTQ